MILFKYEVSMQATGMFQVLYIENYCIWFCTIPSPIRNIITWLFTGIIASSHRGPHAGHPGIWPPGLSILWPPCPTFDPRNSVEKKPCLPLYYLQVVYKMGWLRLRLMSSLDFGGFRSCRCDVKKHLEVSKTFEPVMRSHDSSSFFVHPNMSQVDQHDSAGSFENGWDWLLWVWALGRCTTFHSITGFIMAFEFRFSRESPASPLKFTTGVASRLLLCSGFHRRGGWKDEWCELSCYSVYGPMSGYRSNRDQYSPLAANWFISSYCQVPQLYVNTRPYECWISYMQYVYFLVRLYIHRSSSAVNVVGSHLGNLAPGVFIKRKVIF